MRKAFCAGGAAEQRLIRLHALIHRNRDSLCLCASGVCFYCGVAAFPVSLCGTIAGDPEYTLLLLGLGLKHFSCTPQLIPEIKKIVRSVSMKEARNVARKVRKFDTVNEIKGYLRSVTRKILPEAYES